MIVVTGGAGMIGSNLIAALNARGISNILVVDNLKRGCKVLNLCDLAIEDYIDKNDFLQHLSSGSAFHSVSAVFHLGAASATTEWDGQYLMKNNYEYSKKVLHWCQSRGISMIYASSASVYGLGLSGFREEQSCERPVNMYAFSKYQFDQYVRSQWQALQSQVVGLRYFNVYGPREAHKMAMASTPFQFHHQAIAKGVISLFCGTDGYAHGEQRRDFVHVADCVDVKLWFLDHPEKSGIYNVGTGYSASFNQVADAVMSWHLAHGRSSSVEYIPFPDSLRGSYQSFTQADLSSLRSAGYPNAFLPVSDGVIQYLDWLNANDVGLRPA